MTTIEDKIKKAFSKSKKVLREANKWDSRTQPNLYALENFLRKSGYELVDAIDNGGKIELLIDPIKESHLHPDIVHDIEEGLFYLKVVEHGLLIASDVEEIIKGYTTGLGVLQHLEKLKLETLEVNLSDEEIE